MKEALSNVTEKQKAWFSGVWKSIVKCKKVNSKYQHNLGKASQKTKDAIKNFYGKNVSKQIIKPENLEHIYKSHSKNIQKELADGQVPITEDIVSLIPDVLANPDGIRKSGLTNKSGYESIVLSKEYADGTVHVVEAIQKNNVLEVYTFYVWNKDKTEKKRLAYGSAVLRASGLNNINPPHKGAV